MKKVLLHICCGVCAFSAIEQLKDQGFLVEGFFFNPNIHPKDEYEKRLNVAETVEKIMKIKIHKGVYNPNIWYNVCEKYKDEPEGGIRCEKCFYLRLRESYNFCKDKKFDFFTTTLTISPHKNSKIINSIGKEIAENNFLALDFKKNNGFKRTIELAKKYKVYCQRYCGCEYSL